MVRGLEAASGNLGARGVRAVAIREIGPPESLRAAEIPLEAAADAHRLLQSRTSIGKIVLRVRD